MNTLNLEFLKRFDFLGYEINLWYNKKDRFVSNVGGLLTVMTFTIVMALFGIYL